MSTQSAKKKRLGSRRRGANQNEISKNDEFDITDNTFVAERNIPEENTESLNVLANPDNLTTETQHPPSPELSGNRRKLGSRRRNRLQHVEDSATESCHEPIEEVEEKTRVKETTVTKQMSLAIQSEKQEVVIQGSEHVSTTHEDYFYSAATPKYSEVQYATATNCPKADLESLIPKSENLPTDLDENGTYSKVVYDPCKLVETVQDGIDRSDSLRNEEVKESAHLVGISELTSLSVLSYPGVDQQLIDQLNLRQMPEEKLSNVHSVKKKECKERDDNTELLRKDGNLQGNYLVSESHVESVAVQFCTTPEITTEKISQRENTEIEQTTISSSKEEFPTDEKQNEHSNLFEVKCAHHSEDAVNNVHEQEVTPTQIKEMPQIDDSSESVIHDATGNSKIISGNLTDKTEVSDTYQCELIVERTDEFPINQDISIPDDRQDEHSKKESNIEAVEQKNKGYVSDTKLQISNIGVDTAPSQVYETEGSVQDDTKPSAEQTGLQEKEGLVSEIKESESSLQTLQSEINAPFDSQPQHSDTGFNPIGNRRKMGSSRKNKGRQHVKDSVAESYHEPTEEVVDDTRNSEPIETTEMSLSIETAVKEKSMETMLEETDQFDTAQTEDVCDQVKENALVGGDLHSSLTVDQQMIDQSNYTEMQEEELSNVCFVKEENKKGDDDTELFRQDGNLQTHYFVSESCVKSKDIDDSITPDITTGKPNPKEHTEPQCSVEQAIALSTKRELPTNDGQIEIFNLSEVKGAHQSEDSLNELHEQEVTPTEMHEIPQIDDSSESVIYDATENSEIISGNLADQTEVSDTYQSELIVERTDEFPINQDISIPDDRQDEHSKKESNIEAVEQKNKGYVSDTKLQISNIGVDTAPSQVYETEGSVQDDTKPSAEQTGLQEKDGLVSEMKESESSLQTLQSEINAPFDSQPQHSDTGFNPIGNRRKMGSSRKNKGRQHFKDSVAESYHEPTEEVVDDTRNSEPIETTEMSLSIETAVTEKSMETMLEETDQFDTAQTEDVCDQVKENALVGGDLHSSLTVDQQMIDQSNYTEMPEEELFNVCFVKEENKKGDDDTELFRQDGNLQTHYFVSESCVKSKDIDDSITPDITTPNPKEHTEPQCSVEQAIALSTKRELPTNDGQIEIFNLSEVKGAHQSEDSLNELHEQEVTPTEMHEIPQIDDSSESVIYDATENSEIISGNLADQTEVSDTYQCELVVKSTDYSPTKQELSNPDEHNNHPTKENNFEALEQKNKDCHVYGTKKPQVSDIERLDTALDQVYEIEDRAEDDIKPSAEHTGNQEKEGLFSEMKESESSLQTLQSEINAPLDSQPQHNDTSLNSFGNRRKLGSSRKNKGRQHVKDSVAESYNVHKEDVESTRDNEAFETGQMLLALERSQSSQGSESDIKPATHDSSLYTAILPGYSSDVQGPTTTKYPEADLESLNTKSENLRDDHDGRGTDFNVEVSDTSVGSTLEGTDQSDTLQGQEVTGAHHLEDAVNTVHEQEVTPTEMQEMPQIDYASESVIHDATENSEIISGNLADQTEVSDTYQCELIVKRTGDSPTNQKISNSDQQDEHPTKENNFESLKQKNEDCHIYDIKEPQISHIERVNTAPGQVHETEGRQPDDTKPSAEQTGLQEKEGLVSEMKESESSLQTLQSEINAPFDSQPQHSDTGFNPIGNRRKMGSSRKNKGRQHVKDSVAESYHEPTEEVVDDTRNSEPIETTEMSLSTETAVKEKSMETMLEETDQFDTAQTEDVCDQVKENALVVGDFHSSLTVDQQMIDQSNYTEMPEEELSNVCFVKEENKKGDDDTELLRQDGNLQTHFFVSESCVKSKDIDDSITPEITTDKPNPKEHNELQCSVEQAIFLSPKEELSTSEEQKEHVNLSQVRGARHLEDAVNEVHEEEVKPTQMHQIDNFSVKESQSSLQTLHSEINAPLDSQPQHNDTSLNSFENRRKLGSSRKNKGRQHVKDSVAESYNVHKEDVESTRDNEAFETGQMLLALERNQSSQGSESDIKPATHDSSLYTAIMPGYSSDVQGPTTTKYPEADLESLNTKSENLRDDHDGRGTDFNVEVSDTSVGSTLEGTDQSDTLQGQEVTGAHHLEDAVNTVHEQEVMPTEMQEMPQIDYTSESVIHDATENSEIISGNLADQTEVSDTYQCELIVKRTGDSPTNQTISNSDKQDEHPTKENNFESLKRKNEDCHIYDIKEPQISHIERVNTAPGQVHETEGRQPDDTKPSAEQTGLQEKEGLVSEMKESESSLQTLQSEINAPFDSQPQHSDTGFNPIGNRRKMGSSRKNKGRQHAKDSVAESYHEPTEEVVDDTRNSEPIETTEMSLSIETAVTEKSMETMLEETDQFDTAQTEDVCDQVKENALVGGDFHSSLTVDQQMIDQSNYTEMPEEELSNVCFVKEENKKGDDDTELLRQDGNLQTHYFVSESCVKSKDIDDSITPEITTDKPNPKEHTELQCSVEQAIFLSPKEELSTSEEQKEHVNLSQVRGARHSEDAVNEVHEEEVKPTQMHQINNFSVKESQSSLQTLHSEINAPFDSQPQHSDTGFSPIGNRRKLGSSRKNKGRQHVKDSVAESYHEPTEEVVDDTRNSEPIETTEMSLSIETAVTEKSMETMLEETDQFDTAQTEDVCYQVKENALVGGDLHSSLSVDQQSKSTEMPDEELPNVCFVTEKENKEKDDDRELFRQDGNLQTNYLVSESRVKSEDIDDSITPEITTGKPNPEEHTEPQCSVEQAIFLSPKEELSTSEEQKEHVNLSQVRGARHSEDAVNEVHEEEVKPTQMHQIDNFSVKESQSSLQTLHSEMNAPLDSQPFDMYQSIKGQTPTGFNPTGNRRKFGSNRRNKGLKDTTKMSLATETMRQEEVKEHTNLDFKPAGEIRQFRSTVNDEENTEKMSEEGTILSPNVKDSSTIPSSSGKDDFVKSKEVNDTENKLIKETENLSQLTGSDTVKMDLTQSPNISVWKDDSDIQNISYHDENVTTRPTTEDVLEQEGAFQVHDTEALSCDKEIHMQQTNDTSQTVGDVTIKAYNSGTERSMCVQVSRQDKDGEQFEDPTKKDHEAQEMKENIRAEPAGDVSEESAIPSQQRIHEKTNLDDSENLQGRSKQKRRKMGSTRQTQLNRKPVEKRESDFNTEADMRNVDNMEAVEDLQMIVSVSVEPSQLDDFTTTEMHITSVLAGRNSINPLLSANTEDTTNTGITVGSFVSLCETTQSAQNDEKRPESINVINDQALKSADEPVVADLEIVKSVARGGAEEEHISAQASKQEPDKANEGDHTKNLKMKNANLDSTNKRRKMGSTRRSLGSRTKREDMYEKQEEDNEATEAATIVGVVKTESLSGNIGVLPLHKDSGSEQRKEKEFETVECCHTGESYFKPHQTFEENPVSHGQLVEPENQPTPNYLPEILSTSPKHNLMAASSGKRRKMGSHRKSHGHQNYENQTARGDKIADAQNGRDVRSITDESANKTTEELREDSLGKIAEVNTSDKKPSSNISTSKAAEQPVSEKKPKPVTPVEHPFAEIRLAQESQQTFSLAGHSRAADLQSNTYNVIMVGDSNVGKTSFMKRAQSGKFSLDLPASVGLDSCMWNVVVDGKHVVLQLWDTAGQERFHSMTRQIFHKANAFLLMYDITSSQSFSAVSYWASCIQEGAAENVTILLVGNKSDCAKRQVKTQQVEVLAREYNFEFMECSAATGENVVQSLETVARMLGQKVDTREEAMELHKEPNKKQSSGCC